MQIGNRLAKLHEIRQRSCRHLASTYEDLEQEKTSGLFPNPVEMTTYFIAALLTVILLDRRTTHWSIVYNHRSGFNEHEKNNPYQVILDFSIADFRLGAKRMNRKSWLRWLDSFSDNRKSKIENLKWLGGSAECAGARGQGDQVKERKGHGAKCKE